VAKFMATYLLKNASIEGLRIKRMREEASAAALDTNTSKEFARRLQKFQMGLSGLEAKENPCIISSASSFAIAKIDVPDVDEDEENEEHVFAASSGFRKKNKGNRYADIYFPREDDMPRNIAGLKKAALNS